MSIFSVYWLPFSHGMGAQTDFDICCTVFSPLQNGKKKFKKKWYAKGEKGLTMIAKKIGFLWKNQYGWFFFEK